MDIQHWLELLESFPLDEAETEIERMEDELDELRAREQDLQRRINALKAMYAGRSTLASIEAGSMKIEVGKRARANQLGFIPVDESEIPAPRNATSKAVIEVMRTDPKRVWRALDILTGLAQIGRAPQSKDPRRALDATLHRLATKTGDITRITRGGYMLAPHNHPYVPATPTDGSSADERNEVPATTSLHNS